MINHNDNKILKSDWPSNILISALIGESLFTLFASLTYAYQYLMISLIKWKRWILKGHNSFSYLWKVEPNTPNDFGEILFWKLEILQRMYGSLTFLPHSNFAIFDGWYFLQYCSQRAENCTNCPTLSALLTFAFNSYIQPRLLWVKSYANEEKCKQWRQQRFAKRTVRAIARTHLNDCNHTRD